MMNLQLSILLLATSKQGGLRWLRSLLGFKYPQVEEIQSTMEESSDDGEGVQEETPVDLEEQHRWK